MLGSLPATWETADGAVIGPRRRVGAADLDWTVTMMRRLYPGWEIEQCKGSNLGDGVYPPKGTVYAASWPGVKVIGDQEVVIDAPSRLPEHLVAASARRGDVGVVVSAGTVLA